MKKIKVTKSIGIVFLGNASAACISMIGAILMTRLYAPEEFGIYAAIYSLASLVGVVAPLRYDLTIIMAKTEKDAQIATIVALSTACTLIIFLFLIMIFMSIMGHLQVNYAFHVVLMSFGICMTNISKFTQSRHSRYTRQALISVLNPLLFLLLALIISQFSNPESGLLNAATISLTLVGAYIFLSEYFKLPWIYIMQKKNKIFFWLRRHKDLPLFSAPAVFFNSAGSSIQTVLMFYIFGADITGVFSIASKIIMTPISIVSGSINVVYQREVMERKNSELPILQLTQRIAALATIIALVFSALISMLIKSNLVNMIFSNQWLMLSSYISAMVPIFFAVLVSTSIAGFSVLGYGRVGLFFQILRLLTIVGCLFFSYLLNFMDIYVINTLAWGLFCVGVLQIATAFGLVSAVDRSLKGRR